MKAYSLDLRQRILAVVDRGMERANVAATFGVSLATITRLVALRRTQHNLVAQRPSGRRRTIGLEQHRALWAQLEAHPDATIGMHTERWNTTHGTTLSQWTVGRAIRRLGWTRKQRRWVSPSATSSNRSDYRQRIVHRRAADFVIVDECGSNINLTPTYARAPCGERAYGTVPRNTAANTTLIASMSTAGMGAALVLTGATDAVAFVAYIEQVLGPTLIPGKVVVLDNLSAHKDKRVQAAIEARGCELWYLPAYSPDLSPIEEAFAKLKTVLRRAAARTREALVEAIAAALEQITAADALGFFTHCGYHITAQ